MQFAIAASTGSTSPCLVQQPDPPPPGPGEVLCRTLELGICGTDRDILQSAQPWTPRGEDFLVLGHECLARIEEVGAGVAGWSIGDLVVPAVRRAFPGESRRIDQLPFGTFTERGIVHEHGYSMRKWLDRPEHFYRVQPEIQSVAVLTEPIAVAEKGVNESLVLQQARLGVEIWGDSPPRVLVTGQGPIAFAAVLTCRSRQWPVTMLGRDAADTFRAQLACRLGATYLSANHVDLMPHDVERDGYDLILECTGSDEVMLMAAPALASCGIMVWLGSERVPRPAARNVARLMRDGVVRNHLHVGCVNAAPRDFHAALQCLAYFQRTDPSNLAALITARVPPEESLAHFEHRQPQGIKTVLVYE